MTVARVILGSLVAHAALLAMLAAFVDGRPPSSFARRAPSIELVEPVRIAQPIAEPIEVAILEPVATEPVAPAPISRPAPTRPSATTQAAPTARGTNETASIAETTAPSIGETPSSIGEPVAPSATGPNGWSMRGPEGPAGPDLAIHEDVPHETAPVEAAPKSEKTLQQNGTEWVVPDLVTTMRVSRDGRASFKDKPDIEAHILLPSLDVKQTAKDLGDHLAGWYRDPYAQKNARRYQDMPRHEQAVPGGWDAGAGGDSNIDGSTKQPEELARRPSNGIVPVVGGKLDITSWLHRKFIGDPYSSRKRVLLDGTQAERAQIRARYNREQLDQSAVIMQKNVERVWREIRDPAEKRAALFALWDECAEGDGAAGEAGQRARAIVIGTIRGRLSGAPDRFTDEEIAGLDAKRTSTQHFTPYE